MGERWGVLGGTFDPIHVGHLVAAVEARHQLALDRVELVVAGDPWQKRGRVAASAEDRLAMVRAAAEGIEGLGVSDIEVRRAGPSYTVDTLEALVAPGRSLFLVVGDDLLPGLASWERHLRIAELSTLAVVGREAREAPAPLGDAFRIEWLRIPRLEISSTDLRARILEGRPIDGLVPPGAVRVIRQRRLYTGVRTACDT